MSNSIKEGSRIDERYVLSKTLGAGGIGTVYLAHDEELNRPVAIKLLHEWHSDPTGMARFEREAKALSQLEHPSIVKVLRFGFLKEGCPFLVMEYVEGQSLKSLISGEARLKCSEAVNIAIKICKALEYAHASGIIHRDLKPENIIVQKQDNDFKATLLDFGLCRWEEGKTAEATLTETGLLLGSAFYMSPEQCLGKRADTRSDIYSFGCVFFEMITGAPPFVAANPIQAISSHLNVATPSICELSPKSKLPSDLDEIIAKCTAKDAEKRYNTCTELLKDLAELQRINSQAVFLPSAETRKLKVERKTELEAAGKVIKSMVLFTLLGAIAVAIYVGACFLTPSGNAQIASYVQSFVSTDEAITLLSKSVAEKFKNGEDEKALAIIESSTTSHTFQHWAFIDQEALLSNYLAIFDERKDERAAFLMSLQILEVCLSSNLATLHVEPSEIELTSKICHRLLKRKNSKRDWATIEKTLAKKDKAFHGRVDANLIVWPTVLRFETALHLPGLENDDRAISKAGLTAIRSALDVNNKELIDALWKKEIAYATKASLISHLAIAYTERGLYYLRNKEMAKAKEDLAVAEKNIEEGAILSDAERGYFKKLKASCAAGHEVEVAAEKSESGLYGQFVKNNFLLNKTP